MERNSLYYGDNLDILRHHIGDATIDLVYLDPPFNSQRNYNVLFKEKSGEASPAQMEAFTDTWQWDRAAERAIANLLVDAPVHVAKMIEALRNFIGSNDMMAYLVMMAARLVELHRVLKPTGSLYLHCDPTASHYLKIVLDTIFGASNFENEVVWRRTTTKNDYKQGAINWPRVHDDIFYYRKDARMGGVFTQPFGDYNDEYTDAKYPYIDESGRHYGLWDLTAPGSGTRGHPQYELMGVTRYWRYNREKMQRLVEEGRVIQPRSGAVPRYKRYLDEMPGIALGDVWDDIPPINSQAQERLGYPTQKPLALLERIIASTSNPGDTVLDPFCGCGTAIIAAQKLDRHWIGIDITHLAISLMRYRLQDSFPGISFEVHGEPADVESARDLLETDRYQFQWWALSLVDAKPLEGKEKKGADRGIDGVITFVDDASLKLKRCLVQVKSGHVSSATIRDLLGTMNREQAEMSMLITFESPSGPMQKEAVEAGWYHSDGWQREFPRCQILTIAQLLSGTRPELPYGRQTFAAAQKIPVATHQQAPLLTGARFDDANASR